MTKTFMGIDPGRNGAWALIDEDGNGLHVAKLPYIGGHLDVGSLWADLYIRLGIGAAHDLVAAIEQPFARDVESPTNILTSGTNFGKLVAMCALKGIPHELPKPGEWKKRVGLNSDKDYSRERAGMAWPLFLKEFRFKNSDGKAEALWIAEWIRRKTFRIRVVEG